MVDQNEKDRLHGRILGRSLSQRFEIDFRLVVGCLPRDSQAPEHRGMLNRNAFGQMHVVCLVKTTFACRTRANGLVESCEGPLRPRWVIRPKGRPACA